MRESLSGETRERKGPKRVWILFSAGTTNSSQPCVYTIGGDRLTGFLLFLDDLGNLALQPLLQLLVPIPHPPLQMRTLKASIRQPKFIEDFRLVLETFGRFLVHGIFKQLLPSGDIISKDTTGKGKLCKVSTEDFKVERNLLLVGVSGIERFARSWIVFLELLYLQQIRLGKAKKLYLRSQDGPNIWDILQRIWEE